MTDINLEFEQLWRERFSRNLLHHMKNRGYDQRRLSERVGMTEVTISRYINKKRTPDGVALSKLAFALNCTVNDLIP